MRKFYQHSIFSAD